MKKIISNPHIIFLLILNGILLYYYNLGKLTSGTIILIYYFQSIFLGLFYAIRIHFYNKEHPSQTPVFNGCGFLSFFGGFHFIYAIFLSIFIYNKTIGYPDFRLIGYACMGLLMNGILNIWFEIQNDRLSKNIVNLSLISPLIRIIPIHLFIIASGFSTNINSALSKIGIKDAFLVFLILKTGLELLIHIRLIKKYQTSNQIMIEN